MPDGVVDAYSTFGDAKAQSVGFGQLPPSLTGLRGRKSVAPLDGGSLHSRKQSESIAGRKLESKSRKQNNTAVSNGPASRTDDNHSQISGVKSQADEYNPKNHAKYLTRQSASTRSLDNLEPRRVVGKRHGNAISTHARADAVIFEDAEGVKKGRHKRHMSKVESKNTISHKQSRQA